VPLAALAGHLSRSPSAPFLTACRGSLRRILPAAAAFLAVSYLVMCTIAAGLRSDLARDMEAAGWNQMTYTTERLGNAWTDATIPPGSWRAEPPPKPPRDEGSAHQ
jgi:peptidoglycan/LPS O-acetylase OafA/YrhL